MENDTKQIALNTVADLFSHSGFGDMLTGPVRQDGSRVVNDLQFYNVVDQVHQFLETGKFPALEAAKAPIPTPVSSSISEQAVSS